MASVIGYALLVIAVCYIALRMRDSYNSAGGTVDVITRDAVLFAPILIAVGLCLVLPRWNVDWPWWAYVLVAFVLLPTIWGVNYLMQELGDKEL